MSTPEDSAVATARKVLTDAMASLEQQHAALTLSLEGTRQRITHLLSAPLAKDDARNVLLGAAARFGDSFPAVAGWPTLFDRFISPKGQRPLTDARSFSIDATGSAHHGDLNLADAMYIAHQWDSHKPRAWQRLAGVGGSEASTPIGAPVGRVDVLQFICMALCYLFRDRVLEVLGTGFDRWWAINRPSVSRDATAAMTADERRAEIAALRDEETSAREQLHEVDRKAAEMPVDSEFRANARHRINLGYRY